MNETTREQRATFDRDCPVCGQRFVAKRAWAKYCSVGCRLEAFYLRRASAVNRRTGSPDADPKS